jgi:hypothetical protein
MLEMKKVVRFLKFEIRIFIKKVQNFEKIVKFENIFTIRKNKIPMRKLIKMVLISLIFTPMFGQNKLTKQEEKNGWQLLFDGKSLENWRTYKNTQLNWEVVNGELHNKNHDASEAVRGDLITAKKYKDFVFTCDWKISEAGNSGIIYRASEEFKQPYFTGPEYQVADNEGYKGKMTPLQTTASNYDMEGNFLAKPNPAGQWNSTKILVNGNHVEHWLNDVLVIEYEFNSEKWLEQKEKSKWKTALKYGLEPEGHIALQDHGHEVWYKNLKIKEL